MPTSPPLRLTLLLALGVAASGCQPAAPVAGEGTDMGAEVNGDLGGDQPPDLGPGRPDRRRMHRGALLLGASLPSGQRPLLSIAATSARDVWMVGASGTILHFDGSLWSGMQSGTKSELRSVFAVAPYDAWAVGEKGSVLHYDGRSWSSVDADTSMELRGVWASGLRDVFVVGDRGTLLHYNENGWNKLGGGDSDLYGVWGSSPDNVFAVGQGGRVLRWSGAGFFSQGVLTTRDLFAVWGSGPRHVIAVGAEGTMQRFDGSTWALMPKATSHDLVSVHTGPGGEVMAVGASVLIEGAGNELASSQLGRGLHAVRAIPGDAVTGLVYAVGDRGEILSRSAGGWNAVSYSLTQARLRQAFGEREEDLWAVGPTGVLLHFDGTSWSTQQLGGQIALEGISGTAKDDIWAVGNAVLHHDGKTWLQVSSPQNGVLHAVFAAGKKDVWAVGSGGTLLHYDGTRFEPVALPAGVPEGTTLSGVFGVSGAGGGQVFFVGEHGTILRYAQRALSKMSVPPVAQEAFLESVWGSSEDDIWAVGDKGMVLHHDGTGWSLSSVPVSSSTWFGVFGTGKSDVWVVGQEGALMRFDGQKWSVLPRVSDASLRAAYAARGGALRFFGDRGTIIRYQP